ncbi:MAG: nuclear transport factor 2 family protein [Sphingobacteriales bacterium]|nr:nuclear transport factor 2 family protein [Sphingobacteriales bacterium]
MKYVLLILGMFVVNQISGQNKLEKQLDEFISHWHEAAAKADMKAYFDAFSQNAVFIGTDSSEYWTKTSFYEWAKPYFDRGKAWTLKANSRHIYIADNKKIAWWDELLYTSSGTWIGTGVLQKKGNQWFIMHYTLSVTIPNEKMKKIVEILKSSD